ncbi:MAG: hypothetical protein IRZ03_18410 [Acidobacterium ailaaui]|nr:hypothetical protein [Pseudacidobacterium ailaaui]
MIVLIKELILDELLVFYKIENIKEKNILFKENKINRISYDFIDILETNIDVYLFQSLTDYGNIHINEITFDIDMSFPFKYMMQGNVYFDYDYYRNNYKTNYSIGLINTKYIIDYYEMNIKNKIKYNKENKDIVIKSTMILIS